MISVLIPVYNCNVVKLVNEIHNQIRNLKIDFEILVVDDASTELIESNRSINELSNTRLLILKRNIGRSKIRNYLASISNFEWLIFLDSDVTPKGNNFIKKYLDVIQKGEFKFCFGGVMSPKNKPKTNKKLRLLYGKKREEVSLEKRRSMPYNYFLGANFLIKKEVFLKVKFNELIKSYGFEDFFFKEGVKKQGFELAQIDNAVIHHGIDANDVFLNKTKTSIQTLLYLNKTFGTEIDTVKLIKAFKKVKNFRMNGLVGFIYSNFHNLLEANLKGRNPSLFIFDLYKLSYLCYIQKKESV